MKNATDIRIVRKGESIDRPTFRVASTRKFSDKEIKAEIKDGYTGLDVSNYDTVINGEYV